MKYFFDDPAKVEALAAEASTWLGTPWCANSMARGAGVACHLLPTAIYQAIGALPNDFPRVSGVPNRHQTESPMLKFLDSRPEFERVQEVRPGDLVGIRICKVVDHLGVVLRDNWFIHVLMHKRACNDLIHISPYAERLEAVWRLKG